MSVATAPSGPAPSTRIDSIDLLRGIVMVVMVLDHTRDYVHGDAFRFDPLDLSRTTPILFLTRWVTHFCAPIFVFLAGVSAYLIKARGRSAGELSRFLVTRGLWLIVLEVTVIRTATWFNLDFSFLGTLQVIWVIGWSMIVLAALVHLPIWVAGVFGVAMIALHNAFDAIRGVGWWWVILHQPGTFLTLFEDGPTVWVMYPLIPWVGVLAAGYAFGCVYSWEPDARRRVLVRGGWVLIAIFVVIRATNLYGDPADWSPQSSVLFTALSFVNTAKYPPSLLFLLMTLGPAMFALAWFESRPQRGVIGRAMVTFGRVPLFFYAWQWVLAHSAGVLLGIAAGKNITHLFKPPPAFFTTAPADVGFDLSVAYAAWFTNVLILFVLCRWYAGVKARRRDWWLSYL